MNLTPRLGASAMPIFALRAVAAIGASAIFGLVATSDAAGIRLPAALLAGFLFGTAFVGGTGYRIIRSVWASEVVASPASWSGAAACSAIACILAVSGWVWTGHDAGRLVLGYALAINFAYLAVKASCTLAKCCHAEVRFFSRVGGLRGLEIIVTLTILIGASAAAFADAWLGALVGLSGHALLRLYSRYKRERWSTGWPPLRQPGVELAPLQLLVLISSVAIAWTATGS